jgi:hypothetical protein
MRLITFDAGAGARPAVALDSETILDLDAAFAFAATSHPGLDRALSEQGAFGSLHDLIGRGPAALETAGTLVQVAASGSLDAAKVALAGARTLAPIPRPAKNVFCVGRNYVEHIQEGARARNVAADLPEYPVFFSKPPTAVIGPPRRAASSGRHRRAPQSRWELRHRRRGALAIARGSAEPSHRHRRRCRTHRSFGRRDLPSAPFPIPW